MVFYAIQVKRLHYPVDWPTLAQEIKAANAYVCQACGLQCRRPGEPFDSHDRTLAVCHYDQDYESPEIFLVCLCRKCHMIHDAPHGMRSRRRHQRVRRALAGQLEFSL